MAKLGLSSVLGGSTPPSDPGVFGSSANSGTHTEYYMGVPITIPGSSSSSLGNPVQSFKDWLGIGSNGDVGITDLPDLNNYPGTSAKDPVNTDSLFMDLNQQALDYNSAEAQKNRDWQEYMSNTAHQREMKDLIAAGLNPVLTATGGSGATTPAGSSASTNNIAGSVLGLMGTMATANAMTAAAAVSAEATKYSSENYLSGSKYNAVSNFLGGLSRLVSPIKLFK
ncbi:minor capsid protein [Capybara microvirus Cap1_SP_141]|nr:minor capsid protein [Capybara microvirus Cap1_SP_141]